MAARTFAIRSYRRISQGSCFRIFDRRTSTLPRIVHPHQCHPDVHLGRNFRNLALRQRPPLLIVPGP